MRTRLAPLIAAFVTVVYSAPATAAIIVVSSSLSDPANPGLSAEVEWTLDSNNPKTLIVRARNTSTAVPDGFGSLDQILTGISWDMGGPGHNGSDPKINGGVVLIGASSISMYFDNVPSQLGPGDDISGEWGYGLNTGGGGLNNFISASASGASPFGDGNLDGLIDIDGPQSGLVATPLLVPMDGMAAVQNEIVATLTLNKSLSNLDFIAENGVVVEFGSGAGFIPEPGALALLMVGGLTLIWGPNGRRRNSTHPS